MHRRIVKVSDGLIITESGTGRVLAEVPFGPEAESTQQAHRLARHIKSLPHLITCVRRLADTGDAAAATLLAEVEATDGTTHTTPPLRKKE